MAARLPKRTSEKTIGELIDAYREIALTRSELAAKEKSLSADQTALKEKIFEAFEAQNTTKGAGRLAQASITFLDVPKIVDESAAEKYLKRIKMDHVFTRKFAIVAPAWRELLEMRKQPVPGIETFTVKNLSVTKLP